MVMIQSLRDLEAWQAAMDLSVQMGDTSSTSESAIGSLGELSTELELAHRLKFLSSADLLEVEPQLVATRRLLFGPVTQPPHKAARRRVGSNPRPADQLTADPPTADPPTRAELARARGTP